MEILHIRRGNDVDFRGTPKNFELGEGDILVMSIRAFPDPEHTVELLRAVSRDGIFHLSSEATGKLEPGKYSCDVDWVTAAGRRTTVCPLRSELSTNARKNYKNVYVYPEVTADNV